jgi:hypothetical protein
MNRSTLRLASFLSLFLIAVAGTFLILKATPEGMGLSDDSIGYVAGARSILAGNGYREAWLHSNGPVTHFPPMFSSVLAFFGLFGLDPLRGTRFVNALLFGVNAGLLGILAWRMSPSSLTSGLVLALLFISNGEMLPVHAMAMSEPLFIFFSLLSLWMFDLYFERHHHWLWLLLCAVATGMAYLTRYSGLALVATYVVALFILHGDWKKRFSSIGIFLAGFIPWALGWAIRNEIVAENATNRALFWHPIPAENWTGAFRVFSSFLIPVESWRKAIFQAGIIPWVVGLILGAVLVWTLLKGWEFFSKPHQPSKEEGSAVESRPVIAFTTALYMFAYTASTLASMTLFDAATRFEVRIVAPVLVCLLMLLVYFGVWLKNRNRTVVVVLTIILLGFSFYKQSNVFAHWSKSGIGYASFQWYDSEAMAFLRTLPDDVAIYTDEPAAVYLYTGRGAYVLPSRYDGATAQALSGFEEGAKLLQKEVNEGRSVLALFQTGGTSDEDRETLSAGLYAAYVGSGDFIYTAKP